MQESNPNVLQILCCQCGTPIPANSSNTCASCLAATSDISRGISTEVTIHQCRGCQRWHKPTPSGSQWMGCELESRDLMSLCLGHISGLKNRTHGDKIRLVDASWIWTEQHSQRLKIRLTIQKEVLSGTILQQNLVVVFVVRNQQCVECQAEFRQGSWKSLVQVRQRVGHKRTFLFLEQLILKRGAHRGCLSIETFRDGMDFYFPDKSKANRFISFLEDAVPMKVKSSKKLISTDDKSNISNFKYTNLVEICPLCKDDLLYLSKKTAVQLGNIARLVLVKNVSSNVHVVDPLSGQIGVMSADCYWRDPFRPLITAAKSRFRRYIVLGKEVVVLRKNVSRRNVSKRNKSKLALLTTAKEDDLGVNDAQVEEISHIGYLMKASDVCVGYDLQDSQFVCDGEEIEQLRDKGDLPDVVMVRKLYGGVAEGEVTNRKRIWKLERLEVDAKVENNKKKEAEMEENDEEEFFREVEADKEMRNNMNVYKSKVKFEVDNENEDDDEEDDDDQKVKLDELLDNLALDDGPDEQEIMEEMGGEFPLEETVEGEKAAQDGLAYVGREESRQVRAKDAPTLAGSTFGKDFMGNP